MMIHWGKDTIRFFIIILSFVQLPDWVSPCYITNLFGPGTELFRYGGSVGQSPVRLGPTAQCRTILPEKIRDNSHERSNSVTPKTGPSVPALGDNHQLSLHNLDPFR